jgi:DDE family transposase
MSISHIAGKLRDRIYDFSGNLSKCFGKTERRFIHEMIYGIQARQSVRLSEIARSLNEDIRLKKTIERLSSRLARPGMAEEITERVIRHGQSKIKENTLLILDPTDITKPYAEKMEYLARVHDGSDKVIGNGYWMIEVIAAETGDRDVAPLYQSLYSQKAPSFESENAEILQAIHTVGSYTGGAGVWVIDRGGDRRKIIHPLLENDHKFIIRMRGDRHVLFHGKLQSMEEVARGCSLVYADRVVKETKGKEEAYSLEYGYRKIKLPGYEKPLYLLVIKGFGVKPLILLTTIELRKKRSLLWWVLESYLTRWRIEETIRFIKQSYQLEDVRVLTYERLKNMMALVLAAVHFAAVHLGTRPKLEIMAVHIIKAAKRIFGVPDFRYYALADGIGKILDRTDKGPYKKRVLPQKGPQQLSLFET